MNGRAHIDLGMRGQRLAEVYLSRRGYRVIETNFTCRYGELDIVAVESKALVFVEVKTRTSLRWGLPVEGVTRRKLWQVGRTGKYYKFRHPDTPDPLRVDVIGVLLRPGREPEFDLRVNCYWEHEFRRW